MVATRSSPHPNLPPQAGEGTGSVDEFSYAANPILARASPFPRLRGKVRMGAASSGTYLSLSSK